MSAKQPPRVSGIRATGSDLEAVQREVDAYRTQQTAARGRRITWGEPPRGEVRSAEATKRWWKGLSAIGKWVIGIIGAVIAGTAVLLIRTWLITQGIVRP